MTRAIIFALLVVFPASLHAKVIKWEGKSISVSISTERLTRIEFPEPLRSVFLSRSDIAVEKEEGPLRPSAGAGRRGYVVCGWRTGDRETRILGEDRKRSTG